jgi:hypothetical protein
LPNGVNTGFPCANLFYLVNKQLHLDLRCIFLQSCF